LRITDLDSYEFPGYIEIENREMRVHSADKVLEIQELQLEGKIKMSVKELLNGLHLPTNLKFL
jgi:methionyl-tRNA formyltransferase